MTTDTGPTTPNATEIYALAFAETILTAGTVPAGYLYAQVCDRLSASEFDRIIDWLVRARLVSRNQSHLLTWIGSQEHAS